MRSSSAIAVACAAFALTACNRGLSPAEARCEEAKATHAKYETQIEAAKIAAQKAARDAAAARSRYEAAKAAGRGQRGTTIFGGTMSPQQIAWEDEERAARAARDFAKSQAAERWGELRRVAELDANVVTGERTCFSVEEVAEATSLLDAIDDANE